MKNLNEIMELAKRISKANVNANTNSELMALYGGFGGAEAIAINAARLVFFGKAKLSFNY